MIPADLERMQRLIDREDAKRDRDKDLAWAMSRPDPLSDAQRAQLAAQMAEDDA